jgi:hypothetical protein
MLSGLQQGYEKSICKMQHKNKGSETTAFAESIA